MESRHGQQAVIQRNFQGAKILLVDDDPDQCALIKTVLKACMPEVPLLTATNTEEALHQLSLSAEGRGQLPRLILLDLYLPQQADGLRLIQQLKAPDSPYRLIPLTVLSQSGSREDIQATYDLGVTSYIVKPTAYPQWLDYFQSLREYWWHTVTLPTN